MKIMPPLLRHSLPEGIWHHNSGHEHAQKHGGDPGEVLSFAQGEGHKLNLSEDNIRELMAKDGLVVARSQDSATGQIGAIVGYAIADRSDKATLQIVDMYVGLDSRNRGIGGYMLGALVATPIEPVRRGIIKMPYSLEHAETRYPLVGWFMHIDVDQSDLAREEFNDQISKLEAAFLERKQNILLETAYRDTVKSEEIFRRILFTNGEPMHDLSTMEFGEEGALLGANNYLIRQSSK